ncbi:MAG: hypothetical protein LN413_06440 [Candidatus Thermoplasmatota archaeon]|nr:hypothetical protein [Candidatus Thermoplasmatota archaeon]
MRDELLRCFESANGEFYEIVNQPITDEALREQVRQFVSGVFQQCGASFEEPTKGGIRLSIEQCKANAAQMMGDQGADVIRHHYDEMMKLVTRMPDV